MKLTPKVVISELNPSFVTRKPLRSPHATPVSKEARKAIQKLNPVEAKVTENARPDNGTIDGKERSISPETVTNTNAKPIMIYNGSERKTAVNIPTLRKT
jgi:hypothetical protein